MMMRAITILTVLYVLAMAIGFIHPSDADVSVIMAPIGVLMLAGPILIAYVLARTFVRIEVRVAMLLFDVLFSIFTALIIHETFSGEQDAQYQLRLLLLPAVGFPGVLLVSLLAAACVRAQREVRKTNGLEDD